VEPGGQMWKLKACWVEWRVYPTAAKAEMGSIGRCTGARSQGFTLVHLSAQL
jgi:hypothetical protein